MWRLSRLLNTQWAERRIAGLDLTVSPVHRVVDSWGRCLFGLLQSSIKCDGHRLAVHIDDDLIITRRLSFFGHLRCIDPSGNDLVVCSHGVSPIQAATLSQHNSKNDNTDQVLHVKCETKSVYSSTGSSLECRGYRG